MRKIFMGSTAALALFASLTLTGCSLSPTYKAAVTPQKFPGAAIKGNVHGGQQGVVGTHVYLMAAGAGGTGTASTSLLNATTTGLSDSVGAYVLSGSDGSFSVTGDYTCTLGQQVYMYALGGNPGAGANTGIGLMAVLGQCPSSGDLSSSVPSVQINEVSTVAAAYAIAGYATDATHVGSSNSTAALVGIYNAFANANQMYHIGSAANSGAVAVTPNNGTVPQSKINGIANILAACVNSITGSAACTTLFGAALSPTGAMPADTATAAIYMAHAPGTSVSTLAGIIQSSPPFQPSTIPTDLSITLSFPYFTGFGSPFSLTGIAVDASGSVWTPNVLGTLTTKFTALGNDNYAYGGGHQYEPYGIAFDTTNDIGLTATGGPWVYQINNATSPTTPASGGYYNTLPSSVMTRLASDGAGYFYVPGNSSTLSTLSYEYGSLSTLISVDVSGTMNYPYAAAVDTNGGVWVTSYNATATTATTAATLLKATAFTSTGFTSTGCTGTNYTAGSGVAIDHANNVWVSDYTSGNVVEFANNCTYKASFAPGGMSGSQPVGIAVDGNSYLWTLGTNNNVYGVKGTGASLTGPSGLPVGSTIVAGPAIDGSGNLWVTTTTGVSEMIGIAAPVVAPLAIALSTNMVGVTP